MRLFLVDHPSATWCNDYSMAVLAEDEKHAERRARLSSSDYRNAQDLKIKEIDLNEEQCVLIANVGA